jgi:hypothetical protein
MGEGAGCVFGPGSTLFCCFYSSFFLFFFRSFVDFQALDGAIRSWEKEKGAFLGQAHPHTPRIENHGIDGFIFNLGILDLNKVQNSGHL